MGFMQIERHTVSGRATNTEAGDQISRDLKGQINDDVKKFLSGAVAGDARSIYDA